MSLPFSINPAAIPMVRTRKALLILDLQNDFVSPDGALYTEEPEGYVERILDLAKTFRAAGAGDVIWVRSEFDRHCPLSEDGDQIVTSDAMLRDKKKTASSRGRQPTSTVHESAAMESDEEAFLSVGAEKDKKPCARKGTPGADFAPEVKAAVVGGRDIVFTKTQYSAFASGQQQLVQLLRGRFVTQMYVCGALTNISIYATALGAGQHGYDVTLVEDCCGFRSTMRHLNAVRQLDHLTGCAVIGSETLLEQLQPPAPPLSTGLSPAVSKISLELGGGARDTSPAPAPPPATAKPASPPQSPDKPKRTTPPRRGDSSQSSPKGDRKRPLEDTGYLEAESDPSSSDRESTHSREKKSQESQRSAHPPRAKRSELESSKGPTLPPGAGSTQAEKPRVLNRVKQRVPRSQSDKKPAPSPSVSIAAPSKVATEKVAATTPPRPLTPEQQSPGNMAEEQPAPACGEPLCEGDTHVIANVLPPALAADAFERLLEEVSWAGMSHMGGEVPRRIAVQGAVADDGSMPVYRHPADESPPLLPFSPTVLQIKNEVEKHLGHPLNHVLIQHYRTGNDYISEHSDKTLDIAPGSFIANVSLGAERTMLFRTKRPPRERAAASSTKPSPEEAQAQNQVPQPAAASPSPTTPNDEDVAQPADASSKEDEPKRQTHRAPLPHNSLLRMGLRTNTRWLHAIRQDKRADRDKTAPERAHRGARISLTFRRIGTFIDSSQTLIWGQGATSKERAGAREVVNGQTESAVKMLRAFGAENNRAEFDWDEHYGGGFDVLHMGTPKRFFSCSSPGSGVGNVSVALALAELGVGAAKGSVEGDSHGVRFEDNDPGRTVVEGWGSVLRYLEAVYGAGRRYDQMLPGEVAKRVVRLQKGIDLLAGWRAALNKVDLPVEGDGRKASKEQGEVVAKVLGKEIAEWEGWAAAEADAGASAAAAATASTASAAAGTTGDAGKSAPGVFHIAGGDQPSAADFALWPVLHDIVEVCGEDFLLANTKQYYAAFKERSSVAKALGQLHLKEE